MNIRIAGISIVGVILAAVIGYSIYTPKQNASQMADITVYKDPNCGCCADWADHLRDSGLSVKVVESDDMDAVKKQYGVPYEMQSCHTAKVGDYFVEGHVPAEHIQWMMSEKPDIKGMSVPDMPAGSPGMEMSDGSADAYDLVLVKKDGTTEVHASY
jgi:hypothetical protein